MTHTDQLRLCPTGIQPVINEFISRGLVDYIRNDEDGLPVGLKLGNGFDWTFSASLPDYNTECVVLMRLNDVVLADIGDIQFDSAPLLIQAYVGQIWPALEADVDKLAIYEAIYPSHKQFLDENGVETDVDTGIANPRAGMINKIGSWA